MTTQEVRELFERYNQGLATEREELLIEQWYHKEQASQVLSEEEADYFNLKDKIWQNTLERSGIEQAEPVKKTILWPRIAVAASILLVVGIGGYFLSDYGQTDGNFSAYANDIKPGSNKATLTLANGQTIALSSNKTGVVIDAAKLSYNDGTELGLNHNQDSALSNNTELQVITPRGGQYEIVLPDRTHVWINAATTLKFPSKFTGHNRIVTLTGEAYFEVSKDKAHPFKVKTTKQEIEVLGTHFNVNSYPDEPTVNTNLFEGSVKINQHTTLKPGEQANLYKTGELLVSKGSEDVIAWKTGKFKFDDTRLEVVLRQLARWYDVDIEYSGGVPKERFTGYIDRNLNASDALNILKYTKIDFKIEGKKIIVIN